MAQTKYADEPCTDEASAWSTEAVRLWQAEYQRYEQMSSWFEHKVLGVDPAAPDGDHTVVINRRRHSA